MVDAEGPRRLAEVKVLVVDDSVAVRGRVCAMLREYAFVALVWEAGSVDEARQLVRQNEPDAVVLDIHMPDASGLTLIPSLRALSSQPVVIVLTNDPTHAHRRESLAQGAHHFLDKSRDFEELSPIIAAAAAIRQSETQRPT